MLYEKDMDKISNTLNLSLLYFTFIKTIPGQTILNYVTKPNIL